MLQPSGRQTGRRRRSATRRRSGRCGRATCSARCACCTRPASWTLPAACTLRRCERQRRWRRRGALGAAAAARTAPARAAAPSSSRSSSRNLRSSSRSRQGDSSSSRASRRRRHHRSSTAGRPSSRRKLRRRLLQRGQAACSVARSIVGSLAADTGCVSGRRWQCFLPPSAPVPALRCGCTGCLLLRIAGCHKLKLPFNLACTAGVGLIIIFSTLVSLAALYGAWRLAPPTAPSQATLWARFLAASLYLPRVLFWRPTWAVTALFGAGMGEQGGSKRVDALLGWRPRLLPRAAAPRVRLDAEQLSCTSS